MIVDVLHPASVVHVPPRGRAARHAYVAARAPIEIRTVKAEPRHVRCLASSRRHEHLHEHNGALWQRLVARVAPGQVRDVSPADWTQWLAGHLPDADYLNFQLAESLWMTPLMVMDRDTAVGPASRAYRGVSLDLGAQRSVESDGRAEASAAVARFIAEETLVTPTSVFLRYRPFAMEHGGAPEMTCLPEGLRVGAPFLSPRFAVEAMADMKRLPAHAIPRQTPFLEDLEAVSRFVDDHDVVPLLANWLPSQVVDLMNAEIRRRHVPGSLRRDEALAARHEAVRRSWTGQLGGVDGAEARAHLEWTLATAREWLGIRPAEELASATGLRYQSAWGEQMDWYGRDWCNLAHHLDIILARTAPEAAPEVAPDDEAAMEGLGLGWPR